MTAKQCCDDGMDPTDPESSQRRSVHDEDESSLLVDDDDDDDADVDVGIIADRSLALLPQLQSSLQLREQLFAATVILRILIQ